MAAGPGRPDPVRGRRHAVRRPARAPAGHRARPAPARRQQAAQDPRLRGHRTLREW